jgi:TetR/AcrR family transcriptional regulator, mexJK operon transcriptional repressor
MEAVAAASGVSKRTLYARFPAKPALLQAALSRLIAAWLPSFGNALEEAPTLDAALLHAARRMLATALTPEALAIYRLLIAEAGVIPDLGRLLMEAGAGAAVTRVAARLRREGITDPQWAAAQFQRLVLTGPQHRALGLGPPLTEAERARWARQSVALFLHGILAPG